MKQNLTFWEILPVGLMLFSSFFGAGNLIFPPALGQAAGDHFWSAAIGSVSYTHLTLPTKA